MKKNEYLYELEVEFFEKNEFNNNFKYMIKVNIQDSRYNDRYPNFDNYLLVNEKWYQGEKFRVKCELFSENRVNKRNVFILKEIKCIIIRQQKLVFLSVMKNIFNLKNAFENQSLNLLYDTWKNGDLVDLNLVSQFDEDNHIENKIVQNFLDNRERRISNLMRIFKENKVDICTQVEYFSETITEFKHAHQLWGYTNTDLSMLDRIAYQMIHDYTFQLSPQRLNALLGYYIQDRILNGTIYVPISEVYNSLSDYLLKNNGSNQEDQLFKKLIIDNVESEEWIYRSIQSLVEENKLILLKDKNHEEVLFTPYSYGILNDYQMAYLEYQKSVSPKYEILNYNLYSYNQEEINLFNQILMNDVSIITGGPGTGKTTLCSQFINCVNQCHPNLKIMILATSGKAMQRLSQAVEKEGATIAKFIFECQSKRNNLKKYKGEKNNNRIYYDCDIYIVEECSMLTISDFTAILKNIPSYAKLILVGDPNQIPAIGEAAGSIFADLLQSNTDMFIKKLTKTYRQQEESGIIDLARKIETPNVDINLFNEEYWSYLKSKGITWIEALTDDIYGELNKLLSLLLEREVDFEHVQAITPLNKGNLGSIQLNNQIQKSINNSQECYFNSRINSSFKYNDTIMCIKNNYNIKVFNGMRGYIVGKQLPSSHSVEESICIHLEDGRLLNCNSNDLIDFDLGYAMSVHKMQGSDSEIIIIIIDTTHINFWTRQLLYTAITRSKSQIYFIGQKKVFNQIILKEEHKRYTLLS